MEDQNPQVAVVMVPLPAQSHLNQLLHLSHVITSYGLPVHFAGSASHNRQTKLRLHGWDAQSLAKIQFHDFQLPPYDASPTPTSTSGHCIPFPAHFYPLFEAATHLRKPVFELLQQLSTKFKRIVVIHDIVLASVVQDVKYIPNAESYSLIPISAFTLFLDFWESMPEKPFQLDSDVLPKCIPSHEGCTPPEIDNFVADQFQYLGLESGRLYNTSRPIEGKYVELLEKISTYDGIKHFVLGPFNPVEIKSISGKERHQCLEWLDEQEQKSVIYVSFGSSTSLSYKQIEELAVGLERSEQKFVWVLRNSDTGNIFAEGEGRNPQLPEGYEERVKNRGIVVKDWAPQLDILAHPSIGGFMSHCGWNSCIESISMGVAIAAWPMHSDQPRNAVLVTDVLKIGILVRDWADRAQLVTSTTIEKTVKTLMDTEEGEKMRKRAAELGEAVQGSVAKGGAAHFEMNSFIAHITR
ncbi:zeatin O-glucosyltransferase [Beta vulgaris subsp. vulgaris]|uniref:zeatin O-glucosyltransferase n=1 Tax=Beta vulgaris subsp. vulgaris TaxID=3555 RepID=UPI002036ADA3|nr:zeatin O-glucosyltransferase [Beta vulgaris subsp. vulgaris]